MIYQIGRRVFAFAIGQFCSEVRLAGAAPQELGPLVVVPNHSNFLLDSLLINFAYRREFWFLAKATLFQPQPLAALLRACHLVPVQRRQDQQGEQLKNDETFKFAIEKLSAGKGIVVFPEGVSLGERRLQPIKTGAARIALQSEAAGEFNLGLMIQPVGITYADLRQFRSSVTLTFGTPIRVAELQAAYQADPLACVRELTARIEDQIKRLTVEVASAEHELLVEKIAKLYRSRGSTLDDRERLALVARNVELVARSKPELAQEISSRLDEYGGMAAALGLDPAQRLEFVHDRLRLSLLAPLILIGCVTHVLPYRFVPVLVARYASHPVAIASVKLAAGMAVFAAWYLLLWCVFWAMGMELTGALVLTAFIIFCGYITNNYYYLFRLHMLTELWPGERSPVELLRVVRDELIAELEVLRVD
ncbi:MAG: 1-acyl-sn-glycerol-3-phosphate acyltransferase [Oligoflexia bacterium]|nr:1-acyl-sn-glycerol-3-phosphate acyltransferase [Oligoflexia bacterium]